jgi:hypothetical protein
MRILPNGQVEITNFDTGEKRVVRPEELPSYGIDIADYKALREISNTNSITNYFSNIPPIKTTNTSNNTSANTITNQNRPALSSLVKNVDDANNNQTKETAKNQSLTTNIGNKTIEFVKNFFQSPARFGIGLGNAVSANIDQTNINKMVNADSDLIKRNLELANKLKAQGNISGYKRLLEENKKIADRMSEYTTKNLENAEKIAEKGKEDIAKGAIGTMAFFTPGGSTPAGRILSGAIVGGMSGYGASKKGEELPSIVGGTILGGTTAGALELIGGSYKFLKNLTKRTGKSISDEMAKELSKASPSDWARVAKEHGWDLNELIKEYFPPGSTYDDVLGKVKERGKGGYLNEILNNAEDKIQQTAKASGSNFRIQPTDLIKNLKKEAKLMRNELGTGKRYEAMLKIIEQVEEKYKKGASLNQMLKTLRAANSKFGKNIVEVSGADAVANAAQKLEANTIRRTLKELFPELGEALDTEAKILTLRPILEKARAIQNTKGSVLREGIAQFDLTKPLTWFEPVKSLAGLNKPEVQSKLLGLEKTGLLPTLPEISGTLKTAGIAKLVSDSSKPRQKPAEKSDYSQYNENVNINTEHNTIVPQNNEYITGRSPEEWDRASQKAMLAGDKNSAEFFNKQYEKEINYQKELKKTTTDSSINKTIVNIDEILKSNGKLGYGAIKGRMYESLINAAGGSGVPQEIVDLNQRYQLLKLNILKAYQGSRISDADYRLASKYTPSITDTEETARTKLRVLNSILKSMNLSPQETRTVNSLPNIE